MTMVSHSGNPPRSAWSLTRLVSPAFSAVAIGFLIVMIALFAWQSVAVWRHEGLSAVLENRWFHRQHQFGALAMIYGTIVVSLIALAVAAPVGLGAAIYTAV